ncbi:MAG: hypothetical protein F4082_01205 [Gammaproteobacteria bacterium]|nr:hypothetical protein [Gammaproteobacteria bacterium]
MPVSHSIKSAGVKLLKHVFPVVSSVFLFCGSADSLSFDLQAVSSITQPNVGSNTSVQVFYVDKRTHRAFSQGDAIVIGVVAQSSSDSSKSDSEHYKKMLARVDEALTAWETRRSIVPGFDQSLEFILTSRGKAEAAFFDVDYPEAIRLIEQALAEVEYIFQLEEDFYNINLKIAISAFETEDVKGAQDAIALALALRPNSKEAEFWQQQIIQLPELIAARQAAIAARNEGRLQDEIDALHRVLKIKPNEEEVKTRIEAANRELQDQRFKRAIGEVRQALSSQDVEKARNALTKAQRFNPSHPEITRLNQSIEELVRDLEVAKLIQTAANSAIQDDWIAVQESLEQALKLKPKLIDAIEGRDLAKSIIDAQSKFDDYLARSDRLSSKNIVEAVHKELEEAQVLLKFSPRLRTAVSELEFEMVKWQTEVPVRVISDGKTHIIVRRVGIIGAVRDREIMLKPGTYRFEGSRRGYRNKLVEIKVTPHANEITEVTVICNERV